MSRREITPKMTEARARWLETLLENPRASSGRGLTGFDCRMLGWVEWWTGTDASGLATCDHNRQRVTAAGRAALDAFRGRS